VPYPDLPESLRIGALHALGADGKRLVFYCAFGERSAMAVQAAPLRPADPPRRLLARRCRGARRVRPDAYGVRKPCLGQHAVP